MDRVMAPFTEDQVASVKEYQASGSFHPFTCPACHGSPVLAIEESRLYCTTCKYEQTWVWDMMANWMWKGHYNTLYSPGRVDGFDI